MQEQTHQAVNFLVTTEELDAKPHLRELFKTIDELIANYAEDNNEDLEGTKQYVVGHVGKDNLADLDRHFLKLGDKVVYNDWNALMGIAMTEKKRARIDDETLVSAKKMRDELNGNDQDRAVELRAEIESKKKEKEQKIITAARKNKISIRHVFFFKR